MNVKKFLISGIVGGFVDFLLGWVCYGMLFKDLYPQNENTKLLFIFLGCMTFGLFIAYIFNKWAHISSPITGMKAGAIIGLFSSLSMNLFMHASMEANYQNMAIDTAISTFIGMIMGAAIALTSSKL
jgi:hypothetical protein